MIDSQLSPHIQHLDALLVPHASLQHLRLPETPLSKTHSITIGRQAGAHLLIDEASVSRRHAVISFINGHYMVQDLGSTNGTFVNDKRVELARPCIVQTNDLLRFGNSVIFKFFLRLPSVRSQTGRPGNRTSAAQATIDLKHAGQDQPVLNLDGTLSSPGIAQPVPASVVATFQEVPTLIILPESLGGEKSMPPWLYLLKPNRSTTLGREQGNDIELSDAVVSRRHAEIFVAASGCYIRDLESRNGVIINQVRIARPCRLSHGDRIKIGETLIFFIDLQAGHEDTEKYAAIDQHVEYKEQKVATISQEALPNSRLPTLVSDASTSQLSTIYTGAAIGLSTQKIPLMQTLDHKTPEIMCLRCYKPNNQNAYFCAGCRASLKR